MNVQVSISFKGIRHSSEFKKWDITDNIHFGTRAFRKLL